MREMTSGEELSFVASVSSVVICRGYSSLEPHRLLASDATPLGTTRRSDDPAEILG
jgi:hypothetical protein